MKKQSTRIFLMVGILAMLASVSSTKAQTGNMQTAHIPFAFSVGNENFPAGRYTIKRANPQSDKAALMITSEDGRASKIVLAMPFEAAREEAKARLIFSHYDDRYFLSEVWTPASSTGLELPKSRSERLVARLGSAKRAERVAIALDTRRQ